MTKTLGILLAVLIATDVFAATPVSAVPVSLELALLVDVSSSVDASEFVLQRDGYVNAFQNPAIQAAIANLAGAGGIAVTYVQWSGGAQQQQSVGWTQVVDATTANAFAAAVSGAARAFSGITAPGSAINFTTPLFSNNGFEGTRLVMDVSGDGVQNSGADTSDARDAALAAGITTINGLAIGPANILTFYQNNVIGGSNEFAVGVADFDDFAAAVQTKIGREITSTPEPGLFALLGFVLVGLAAVSRRRSSHGA